MRNPVVAVDFDDVVAAFNQAYIAHHNRQYGTPFVRYETVDTFDMTVLYGVDQQTIVDRVRKFCHNHHFEIWPWSDALEGLGALATRYELHIVTSRCESLHDITAAWLLEHELRDLFTELHFTNGFGTLYPDRKRGKLEVCQEIGAVALIEDAPVNAQQVADGGVPVLMPNRPWNMGFHHRLVQRFSDMSEVSNLLT